MSHDRDRRLADEYERLIPLPTDQQSRALGEIRIEDAELAEELARMLASTPLPNLDSQIAYSLTQGLQRQEASLGPYTILDVVGEGGTSIVYSAIQRTPIERLVAIKLLKPGLDSEAILRRTALERRLLASLEHPHIAPLLDAGEAADGRPYFVLPLLTGKTLPEYCRDRNLSIRDRVELFLQACDAVRYAHQRAVIHRDLKPANILVSVKGDSASVRVIDFGIAKLLEPEPAATVTDLGVTLGTPGYMSPEQAAGNTSAIDVRTDVFGLGAVLYEALTGAKAFDSRHLAGLSGASLHAAMLRATPASFPDRTRVRTSRIDADLEAIVLKTLAFEQDRRYTDVGELIDDLQRWRHGEAVLAMRGRRRYFARKFVRRHRLAFVVGASVFVGLVMTGVIALREWDQRLKIATAQREADYAAGVVANFERYLSGMLDGLRPDLSEPEFRTALSDVLAIATRDATGQDDEVQLRIAYMLAQTFGRMGRAEAAVEQYTRALAAADRLPARQLGTLDDVRERLAWALVSDGRTQEAVAVLAARDATQLSEAGKVLRAMVLAQDASDHGLFDEAVALLDAAATDADRCWSGAAPDRVEFVVCHVRALTAAKRAEVADEIIQELLKTAKAERGEESPLTLRVGTEALAVKVASDGLIRHVESLESHVELAREELNDLHPVTLRAREMLARAFLAAGRTDEGVREYLEVLNGVKHAFGVQSAVSERTLGEVVAMMKEHRRFAGLEDLLGAWLTERGADGVPAPDMLVFGHLQEAYYAWGKWDKARELHPVLYRGQGYPKVGRGTP
jgi:tRNA A-37 threonylcarbamoyl transferase component Bud32